VSARRLATAWLPAFGLQAAARRQPELKKRPLAREERGRVSECSRLAVAAGVRAGQTPARARSLCPELKLLHCDEEQLSLARRDLIEVFLLVAPRVVWGGGGTFHLDAAGLIELYGSERAFLAELLGRVESFGLVARVGLAGSRFASTAAARLEPGPTVVPPGGDAAFLADRPLDLLPLPGRTGELLLERLRLLGLRTLGELVRLPADSLNDRFGRELKNALRLARGEDPFLLDGHPGAPPVRARRELDEAIAGLEPVTFLLKSCCEELTDELRQRGTAAARVGLSLAFEGAPEDHRELLPSRPLFEPRPLLDLCRLELEARRVVEPVLAVEVAALEEMPVRAETQGLFGRRLDHAGLAAAVDRIRLLLGEERVVTPSPREAHRREARVGWRPFEPGRVLRILERGGVHDSEDFDSPERLLERPLPVMVSLPGPEVPGRLCLPHAPPGWPREIELVAQAGPCRISGEWWDGAADVDRDEHVLLAADGGLYRAARDRKTRQWSLLAVED